MIKYDSSSAGGPSRRTKPQPRELRDDELERVVGGQTISADIFGDRGLRARDAAALQGGGFSGGGATGTW